MVNSACPLCASSDREPVLIDEPVERTGSNVLCRTCGLVYHHPAVPAHEMARYYATEYNGEYSASESISRAMAHTRMDVLRRFLDISSPLDVLEIGCAQGEFLSEMAKSGHNVSGVEPSRAMSQHCREAHGLCVHTGVYDDLPHRPGSYDLGCMFHVLEHMPNPLACLQRLRTELRPGGLLFVEVPTLGDCQLAMVFKAIHPVTFVPETLQAMLQRAGFEITHIAQRGYHLQAIARVGTPVADPTYPPPASVRRRLDTYLDTRRAVVARIVDTLAQLRGVPGGAIYGAGLNTLDLDHVFPLSELHLEAAFDADTRKQGGTILGLEVRPPSALHHWNGRYLIVSTYAFQEDICQQYAFLKDRGITLVTLYDKETT